MNCFVGRHSISGTRRKVKNNDALYRKTKGTGQLKHKKKSKSRKGKQRKRRNIKRKWYAKRKKRRLLMPKLGNFPASTGFSRKLAHSYFTPPYLLRQIDSRARTAATHSPFQFRQAVIEAYRHSSTTEGLASARKILSRTKNEERQEHLTPRRVVQSPALARTPSASTVCSNCSVMDDATGLRQTNKYATQSYASSSHVLPLLHRKNRLISSGAAQEIAQRTVAHRELHYSSHTNIQNGSYKLNNHDSMGRGQPSTR